MLQGLCFYGPVSPTQQDLLFAFKFSANLPLMDLGWNICDLTKEYDRLGLVSCQQWKVTPLPLMTLLCFDDDML